jgi:HK97 family phage portal protein
MWPFDKALIAPTTTLTIDRARDDVAVDMAQFNGLRTLIDAAIQKQLDPSNVDELADGSDGHFQPEFELIATAGKMKSLYRREPWVYTTASLIARTLATVPFAVKDRQTGEIDANHPMNMILKSGNQIQDGFSLDWAGNLDLILGGNFFEIVDGDQIYHVPVELVTLKVSDAQERKKYGPIMGIDIQGSHRGGGPYIESRFIEWKDVIHHKIPNPFSPFIGMSMVAAAARPILLDRHKNEFEMAFYLRGATNAGVIETTEDITKSRMERLMRTFESSFSGRRNWFRQLFLPKGAKWVNAGLTMAEMEHLEGLRENRLTLLAVLGVPPSKVGIVQDVNRSTSEAEDKTFYVNTILPLAKLKASGWNQSDIVQRKFKGEIEIVVDLEKIEAFKGGILSRAQEARALDNIALINEQREIAGLPKLKPTDPRGKMMLVELIRSATPDPYGMTSTTAPTPLADLGTVEDAVGAVVEVDLLPGDGEDEHTHTADVDAIGNGSTTSTIGDTAPHDHEIVGYEVQVGGADGHTHPPVEHDDEKKKFGYIKASAINAQANVEATIGKRYMQSYDRNLTLKFEQEKKAVNDGMNKMALESYLNNTQPLRAEQYRRDAVRVLADAQDRGFGLAQTQTRSIGRISKKGYEFTPQDVAAINAIKQQTQDGKRATLEARNIQSFFGFDSHSTENIMRIIDESLAKGETLEQTAKRIEQKYGENYGDQAFTIARTETLFGVSDGVNWQHETLNKVFTKVNKQWFHVGDAGSNPMARVEHAEFENAGESGVVSGNYTWVNPTTGGRLKYPRDPQGGASDVINCRCSMVSVIPKDAQSNADTITGGR